VNVLVIAPHPDDEAIGCGGAIRLHATTRGDRVAAVFLTSGERGLQLPDERDAWRIREREAEASAAILGIAELSFLRLPDTHLAERAEAAVAALCPLLARERPGRIYVPHPTDGHPDHVAAAPILWQALSDLSADGVPPTVLGYEVWTPMPTYDDGADITSVMADKLRAVRCHKSQVEALRYDRGVRGLNQFRGAMAWKCRYAEVYQHLFAPSAPHTDAGGRA
jgi:LmbE family N-acetylglucosaminyl deacetylase